MRRSDHRSRVSPLRALRAFGLGAIALGAGCTGKDPYSPGTKLGTFHVTGKLTQTSCGPTPNPWDFDVRINHDGSTLYWIQGGAPVQGNIDRAATTQLKSETTYDVRAADERMKLAACTIARTDLLDLVVVSADAGAAVDLDDAQSFTGALSYTFAPTEGSDCLDQITSAGGGFDALPCQVRYELVGTRQSAP